MTYDPGTLVIVNEDTNLYDTMICKWVPINVGFMLVVMPPGDYTIYKPLIGIDGHIYLTHEYLCFDEIK